MVKLGDNVKDRFTGFKGVAVSKIEYLSGCIQFGVAPKVGNDNKKIDTEYIDEGRLDVVGPRAKKIVKMKTGADFMSDAPKK